LVGGVVLLVFWLLIVAGSIGDGQHSLTGAVVGAALFAGFLFGLALVYPKGMGMGDVKFALLLGAFTGYLAAPSTVAVAGFMSLLAGASISIYAIVARGGGRKTQIPFGPGLAAGTITAVLVGREIAEWYARTGTS
jgi:leader peptidase (prepilin peptidase)/N-methyltransferase